MMNFNNPKLLFLRIEGSRFVLEITIECVFFGSNVVRLPGSSTLV